MNEKKLTIRLTEKTHWLVKERTRELNISVNALINLAIDEYIKRWFLAEKTWGEDFKIDWNKADQYDKKDAQKD